MGPSQSRDDSSPSQGSKATKPTQESKGKPIPHTQKRSNTSESRWSGMVTPKNLTEDQKARFFKQGTASKIQASVWFPAGPDDDDFKELANVIKENEQPGEVTGYHIYWTNLEGVPSCPYTVKVAKSRDSTTYDNGMAAEEYGRTLKEAAKGCIEAFR